MFGKLWSGRRWRNFSVVQWIIGANALVWLLLLVSGFLFGIHDPIRYLLTLDTTAIIEKRWWEFLTYMWVHADPYESPTMGLIHILFNMSALWMFGRLVEVELGKRQFLSLYIIGGIISAGAFFLEAYLRGNLEVPYVYTHPEGIVGASGAVMGIVAAFSVLRPDARLFIFFIPYPVKAKWAVFWFILISFALIFVPILGFIGHSAHIGGALVGYLWIWAWRKNSPKISDTEAVLFVDHSSGHPVMEYVSVGEIREVSQKAIDTGIESLTPRERGIYTYFISKKS